MSIEDNVRAFTLLTEQYGEGDLRHLATSIQADLQKLRDENERLRRAASAKPQVIRGDRRDGTVWQRVCDKIEGPFCGVCYGESGKLLPIPALDIGMGFTPGSTFCRSCNTDYDKSVFEHIPKVDDEP